MNTDNVNTLNERITDLIQSEVDGVLAASDRDELKTALASSAAARAFRDEMLHLAKILNGMKELDLPAGLNRRILDSIELPSPRQLPAWLRNWFPPASYGLAVAAGMLLSVGVVKLLPSTDDEMSSLVGTMVKHGEVLPKASRGQLAVDLAAVTGSVLLKELDGAMALQFDLDSAESVDIDIQLAAAGLQFGGFADDNEGVSVLEVSGGNVRVVNQGSQQFVLFLRPLDGVNDGVRDLGVTISQDSMRIFKGSIAFGG
ncbi:MAG: hypothetical protein SH820_08685 [Xanthomonadales bacterium]|nr:hypothetical protein [Xanthomonadales bacterium]